MLSKSIIATLAGIAALGIATTSSTPALAANPVSVGTVISSPAGGRVTGTISFTSTNFTARLTVADIASDGRGAIGMVSVGSLHIVGDGCYAHDTDGNGTSVPLNCTYGQSPSLPYVEVRACNGGSQNSPENCGAWKKIDNPVN